MVLDGISKSEVPWVHGKFVFKNTYAENKKVKIKVNAREAPDEFFFVHIQLDTDRLDQIRQREAKRSRKRKAEENQKT